MNENIRCTNCLQVGKTQPGLSPSKPHQSNNMAQQYLTKQVSGEESGELVCFIYNLEQCLTHTRYSIKITKCEMNGEELRYT